MNFLEINGGQRWYYIPEIVDNRETSKSFEFEPIQTAEIPERPDRGTYKGDIDIFLE